jgi:signal transduction histidine kinase
MLTTVTNRLRNSELVLRQSEKMAQLGTLTAGITHELNNPASAARRGSAQLQVAFVDHQRVMQDAFKLGFSEAQWDELAVLDELARKLAAQPVELSSLGRSDREEEIEEWLDSHGIENSWDYAPLLVNLGYEPAQMDVLERKFPAKHLEIVIRWMGSLFTIHSLLEEINQGTSRIGEIVRSLKSYVYLDQAPVQSIDIHEGLDNTLVMMRSKLKAGVLVQREYDAELPHIQGYGSELNQVWTNLIDNAIDAMEGKGTIIIRTQHDNDWVIVEVEDSGPGMPEEIQQKLFSPFFTTKPLGKGTGLGLNISYKIIQKHHGEIKVFSQPGRTTFYVRLPVNFDEAQNGDNPLPASPENSDECMLEILETTETIAVVGISNRQSAPAHTVPAYLKKKGYRIIPVNPKFEHVLDEKAYPDLLSLKSWSRQSRLALRRFGCRKKLSTQQQQTRPSTPVLKL